MWSRLQVFVASAPLGVSACSVGGGESSVAGDEVQPAAGERSGISAENSKTFDQTPGSRPEWVVLVGDSFISGEGARWAGNTLGPAAAVDGLGRDAYLHGGDGAAQQGCHRADVSAGFGAIRVKNLACSGATTRSRGRGADFTPGLDFYHDRHGRLGQALALRRFAERHQVNDVALSVGGNDFGFGSVVTRCITTFLWTVGPSPPIAVTTQM
ncbi:MAG: hypothetical protein WKF73_22420 [Nocardioidaceae bacterium]